MKLTRRRLLQSAAAGAAQATWPFAITPTLQQTPKTMNPQILKVSPNNRFLMHADGTPFFYLADTAWELFHRLNREEADLYLAKRAAQGFTVIQAVVLAELGGLVNPNPYGHLPLVNNDPNKPVEDYFKHVDYIVNKANSLGLTIAMLPTWGDKWNKKWGLGPEIFTSQNAETYGQWLAKRYADKAIIWILGGDRPIETPAHTEIIRAMAKGIKAGDQGRHLITFHTWGGSSSSKWLHEEEWLDFNMLQSGHKMDEQNWRILSEDYKRTPTKPCIDGEPGYENISSEFKEDLPRLSAHQTRKFLYWALFAGAHGHTYGCNDIWQMWAPGREPTLHADTPWNEAIHFPGADQMRHAKTLLLARDYFTRIPDQSLVVSQNNPGPDYIAATRDQSGKYALVYSPTGQSFTLDLTKLKGPLKATWINPKTGQSQDPNQNQAELEAKSQKQFTPPTKGPQTDWLLTLDQA